MSKKSFLGVILEQWGDLYLDELTDEHIDRYKWQMAKERKFVMFNRVLAAISHAYTIAIEYGKIDRRPIITAKKKCKEKGRLRYLMPDEVQILLAACPDQLRAIVLTALHTGMRKNEVLSLRLVDNVNLKERLITLTETKNDERGYIPIDDTLFAALKDISKGKEPGDYIFAGENGLSYRRVGDLFDLTVKKIGMRDFHFHDLRHTFASNLVMAGVDLVTVKELCRHKKIETTMKYIHVDPEHKTKAIYILDKIFTEKSEAKVSKLGSHIGSH